MYALSSLDCLRGDYILAKYPGIDQWLDAKVDCIHSVKGYKGVTTTTYDLIYYPSDDTFMSRSSVKITDMKRRVKQEECKVVGPDTYQEGALAMKTKHMDG